MGSRASTRLIVNGVTVKEDLKLIYLVPVFGAVGAAATGSMWFLFDRFLAEIIPPAFAVLACVVFGLFGPIIAGLGVWFVTRRAPAFRWPAAIGLGMVVATELAFYVPVGFMAIAFHQASL